VVKVLLNQDSNQKGVSMTSHAVRSVALFALFSAAPKRLMFPRTKMTSKVCYPLEHLSSLRKKIKSPTPGSATPLPS
jgi:hypothetical protein